MMDWALSHLERQVNVVTSAPIPFAISIALLALVIIGLLSMHYEDRYRDRLETKDAQIDLLQGQLDKALRDTGAPAETGAGSSHPPRRTITQDQISAIRGAMPRFETEKKLAITSELGCADCAVYQNELALAFSSIHNLKVDGTSGVLGPGTTHQTGIIVAGEGLSDPDSFVNKISNALSEAGIKHLRLESAKREGWQDARIEVQTPRKY